MGLKERQKKYFKIELEVLFYSLLGMCIIGKIQNSWSLKDIASGCLPVISGKYWYITSYLLLLVFSKYINMVPEKLKKDDFEKLLLLMFTVFSVIPTFLYFHIMNDGGKGFANMLMMYFIGRYIRIYCDGKGISTKSVVIMGVLSIGIGLVLNGILSLLRGEGVYAPFARDCSSTIVLGSISIFMIFKKINIKSKWINGLAKHVLAIYLFEGAVRMVLNCFFDITSYVGKWYLYLVIIVYVMVVMVVCTVVDLVRAALAPPVENIIYSGAQNMYNLVMTKFK